MESNNYFYWELVNKFYMLKTLNASMNFITSVSLHLKNLVILDLHNNNLTDFPSLEHLKSLEELNVSKNLITSLHQVNLRLDHPKVQN